MVQTVQDVHRLHLAVPSAPAAHRELPPLAASLPDTCMPRPTGVRTAPFTFPPPLAPLVDTSRGRTERQGERARGPDWPRPDAMTG